MLNFVGQYIDLKYFLDEMVYKYENTNFIESDPIQIPYYFKNKHDIEISAFLTAILPAATFAP